MKKALLLTMSLWVVPVAFAQQPKTSLTLDLVATPVPRALETLSKETGLRLASTAEMGREVIILRLKDAPVSTVLEHIAKVTTGRWDRESDGTLRLIADNGARRVEANAAREAYTRRVQKALDEFIKPVLGVATFDEKAAQEAARSGGGMMFGMFGGAGNLGNANPASRAIARLARDIGARTLASIDENQRVVFSTNPTRMQRAMPSSAGATFRELVSEHRIYARAVGDRMRDVKLDAETQEAMNAMREMFGIGMQERPLEGPPARALMVVSRNTLFGGLQMDLRVYDANGNVVLAGSQSLNIGGGLFDITEFTQPNANAPKPNAQEQPMKLSELSTQKLRMGRGAGGPMGAPTPVSEELKKELLRPDVRDPLSYAESEALIETASRRNLQLVANLPDDASGWSVFGLSGESITPSAFLERLQKNGNVQIQETNGYMLVQPLDGDRARRTRVERTSLARLLGSSAGKEFVPLDAMAAYALVNPPVLQTPAALPYLTLFAPDAMASGFGGRGDWNMLRLYGTLSAGQRQSMQRGLSLGLLSPTQRTIVEQMLFGPDTQLQALDPNAKPSDLPWFFDFSRFSVPKDFRTEPTEAMANGLPAQGTITLNVSDDLVAKPTGASMPGMSSLGIDEIAMFKYFKEAPQFQQFSSQIPSLGDLRVGKRYVYDFTFTVAPGVISKKTLIDNTMDPNTRAVAMANLPPDVQRRINARVESFKKLPFFNMGMMGGGFGPRP